MKVRILGRSDRLWLRKQVLKRAGLELVPKKGHRIGFRSYNVEIPDGYSINQAKRFVRAVRTKRRTYKLSHVSKFLMREMKFHLYVGFSNRKSRLRGWGPKF